MSKVAGRFFSEEDLTLPTADLSEAEAKHAIKSKRLKPEEFIEAFDGHGHARRGFLEITGSNRVSIRFSEPLRTYPVSMHRLFVAVSPPKSDRMTYLVEKLSELGADVLIPTIFRHSLDAGVKAHTGKVRRWHRTAIESAKQCGRYHLLDVENPTPIEDLFSRFSLFDLTIVLLSEDGPPLFRKVLQNQVAPSAKALILIGPEGGFTGSESARAQELGAIPASLGKRILRIETAALAATAIYRAESAD